MFDQLENSLLSLAVYMPLPLFAFISSFLEEVVAPIPSGAIILLIGTLAKVQSYTPLLIFLLAVIASAGKVFGGLVVFTIADKTEDFVTNRFSRFLGVSHTDIEKLGKKFGKGWKDYALLIGLRAIPILPSVVISFGAGVIKLPVRLFIIGTFFGSIIRDLIFITIGYAGLSAVTQLLSGSAEYTSAIKIGIALLAFLCAGVYVLMKRNNKKPRSEDRGF